MTAKFEVPRHRRPWPWVVGIVVTLAVWQGLLQLTNSSGAFAVYVAIIVGFNAYAFAAAGLAKAPEEEDEGFFLSPHQIPGDR